jgi:predicted RNA-binding Zn ribbon-like protein
LPLEVLLLHSMEPLTVELMNTIWADRDGRHDGLTTRADCATWLTAGSDRLPDPVGRLTVTSAVAEELRGLRDALRRLAAEVTADPRARAASATLSRRAAVAALNRVAAGAPAWLELTWPATGEPRTVIRSPRPPAAVVLAAIAEQGARLFADPGREGLRACLAPGCVLYFVRDHPRRAWCSAACGNRARVARHYLRHRPGD